MARNNYRRLAASRLAEYARWSGRRLAAPGDRPAGSLVLSSESGVKRLREFVTDGGGVRDIGPGFLSWEGLYGFLDGMCEAERWRSERAAAQLASDLRAAQERETARG